MHSSFRRFALLFTAAALLFGSGVASAQTDPPPAGLRLSLGDAVGRALEEGTNARLARSAQERAELGRSEALYNLGPQADARLMRYNESINLQTFGFTIPGQPPVVGPFNVTDAQITAAMQVFNLAAIRLYQSRQQGVKASRYDLERVENDVATAVARLYVLVQRADAQIASRAADVKLFEQLSSVAGHEFEAGTGTRLDVAQANLQVSRAREALLIAQNERASAALALLNAIAADESSEIVLVDPLPAPQAAPAAADALSRAKGARPELKALDAHVREAELALQAAKSRWVPRVGVEFQGDMSGNKSTDLLWSRRIAGSVSVPIFRGEIPVQIARARLELEDVTTQRDSILRDVERDVRTSILSLTNAEARVKVAEESVKVAEEALTIARDRKGAGYGSPVEVDRAEDQYQQAHEALIAAQADAALANVALQHATGDIRTIVPGESR